MDSFVFLDDISSAESEPFSLIPIIFSGDKSKDPSEKFNAVLIKLDGRANSALDWRRQAVEARSHIAQGLKLFWELDLGLFESLQSSIFDQTQYMTLSLSLQHFRDTLWREFQKDTIAISIFQGSIDFTQQLAWDEKHTINLQGWLLDRFETLENLARLHCFNFSGFGEITPQLLQQHSEGQKQHAIFCCDAAVDYLDMLAGQLPGELPVCACLDISSIQDPLFLAQLLSKERFERLHRVVSQGVLPITSLTQRPAGIITQHAEKISQLLHPTSTIRVGVCLPNRSNTLNDNLKESIDKLLLDQVPFRIISEATLTSEWDGLEHLIVSSSAVSPQGIRKLRGFAAAGGIVVDVDHPSDRSTLPFDVTSITFADFC